VRLLKGDGERKRTGTGEGRWENTRRKRDNCRTRWSEREIKSDGERAKNTRTGDGEVAKEGRRERDGRRRERRSGRGRGGNDAGGARW